MAVKLLFVYIFAIALAYTQSARILAVFPTPSISHQVVFRKLTQELARRGHDMIVITPDPAFPKGGAPANIKEIDVHDISYNTWRKLFLDDYKVQNNFVAFSDMRRAPLVFGNVFKSQLQAPEVQEILSNPNQKFDLIIIEGIIRPALVFSHIFKAPIILVSSLGAIFNDNHNMGLPSHPLLYPTPIHRRIYDLSLWEKLEELYDHYSVEYALYLNEEDENVLIHQIFGPDMPPLSELYKNIDMFFINVNPIWADNQPVPTNVVYMGGIHQTPEKELPNDLKTYLESSRHGVIYLSFGTNVLSNMMPPDKIQMIIKVLSNLPYDVLWKWDKEELPGKSDNIRISKWFPQSDLLKHPKVKLFITQGGLQSTDEAITAGVPLVAIPMLGDQWYNAEKYVKHRIGKHLNIKTLTEDIFNNAVETVIKDESYRKNIVKLRQQMLDQPETPLQRAVWWTEYVIRHGGAKHLRAASANISYAQYFEFELLLVLLSIVLILLAAFVIAIILSKKIVCSIINSKIKIKIS